MQEIIKIENLKKDFGSRFNVVHALKDVNLILQSGEILGFLGPNGAGKSTTIRVILGMLRKTSGSVKVFGLDPFNAVQEIHSRLAYVPGEVNLWDSLSGGETIDFLAKMHKIDTKDDKYVAIRQELVELFALDVRKKVKQYSKGNKQKVALIASFAIVKYANLPLVIFDEPTSGLDPLMEEKFVEQVFELRKNGTAVLLSSHILSEVEKLCDRVLIIKEGVIIKEGTINEIREAHGENETLESAFLQSYE